MSCKKQLLVLDPICILPPLAPGGVCVCQRWKQPDHTLWSTASWCWLTGSAAGLNCAVPKDRSVPEKQWLQRRALFWTLTTLWMQEMNISGALWRDLPGDNKGWGNPTVSPPSPELQDRRSDSPCHGRCCHTRSLYIDIWPVWRSDRSWQNLWSWKMLVFRSQQGEGNA